MFKTFSLFLIILFFAVACDTNKNAINIQKNGHTIPLRQQNRFCFIHDIRKDSLNYILIFDPIDYSNVNIANVKKIIELPNGFYFSNEEKKLETLQIESNVSVIMQTFSFNDEGNFNFNQKVNISDLVNAFKETEVVRFKHLPFRIVSTGTKVDSLFEIYIP